MGPQLYRCGNAANGRTPTIRQSCFNGAATLSLRKSVLRLSMSTRRTFSRFNGATTLSLRKYVFVVLGLRYRYNELQWGCNFIVAEIRIIFVMLFFMAVASMGPQLYRCGNRTCWQQVKLFLYRFNWGRTLSLRKYDSLEPAAQVPIRLQWGHNFIVAEMRQGLDLHGAACVCFNGAATLSLRK